MKETVRKLDHIEHILLRPDTYVGSTSKVTEEAWVVGAEGTSLDRQVLTYSPALLKIFDELLVNAIDRNALYPKDVNTIAVSVDDSTGAITVENNGPLGGLAAEIHETHGVYNPELIFGHLMTSTNYDDSVKRIVGGRNGYGAKLCNVYSKQFSIKIKDHVNKKTYNQHWTENMRSCMKPSIRSFSGATSSVSVTFIPDWTRFGMSGLEKDFIQIVKKRCWDAAVCTSANCKLKWQGEKLERLNLQKYAAMHGVEKVCVVETERWSVAVGPSADGFQQVSFVNGICTTNGGSHVDHVVSVITQGILEEMKTKIQLKPTQVKNCLHVFVRATLENPSFSSQVKSECTSKVADFGSRFEPTTKTFFKNVLKTGVADELTALSRFKEMKALQKTDGSAKKSRISGIPKLDDANRAGTKDSHKCCLILTEGDSAKSFAIAGLSVTGRDHFGVFPLRGKFRNVRDASVSALEKNEEFTSIKKILGLQQGKVYTDLRDLRYGRLLILTDADHDGSHIKALLVNMIECYWPSLLQLGFVWSMVTPIKKATRGKDVKTFFNELTYQEWDSTKTGHWNVKHYKGLGTSSTQEAKEYFREIDRLSIRFNFDHDASDSLALAFDKKLADQRKVFIQVNTATPPTPLPYGNMRTVDITEFIHRDFVNFSIADLKRSVPSLMDGLKPSQRKVLHACFLRNLSSDMKVAQLAAYVSEATAYHHGEQSLAETIVSMAQDYVGSNNINLLVPSGQFGSRLMGGKDASQTRYIYTRLSPVTRKLFDKRDDDVLTPVMDDGKAVEPEFFAPILPMVLVNGARGVGTGYSCDIPSFDPTHIRDNILRALGGQPINELVPFFKGFKGRVFKSGEHTWMTEGIWERGRVLELPPGVWTQKFKETLDGMIEDKTITGYTNNSSTDDVDFTIQGYTGTDPYAEFGLRKSFAVSNMHLFHPESGIKKFATPEDILIDFMKIRLKFYKMRKDHLVKTMARECRVLECKSVFMKMVLKREIEVLGRKKALVIQDLQAHKFPTIEDSYDYLLKITLNQCTEEAVVSLLQSSEQMKKDLYVLENTEPVDMWKSDLKNL